jgi:hypothetical protein
MADAYNTQGKRSVQINVRLTEKDYKFMQQAATKLWPNAVLSNSSIVLGLAKIAAQQIVESK